MPEKVKKSSEEEDRYKTCKIQEHVSCRFFCVIQIGVRFYRYIEEYADFIFISEFCNLSPQTFVLLVKGLWKTNNRRRDVRNDY